MLRTATLIFRNDFRLLLKDRAALFMLFLAPIVIIAVAGFSLGNIYGSQPNTRVYMIPVVDEDHGAIAKAILHALAHDHSIEIVHAANLSQAREIVTSHYRAPLAIVIPAHTTAAFQSGATPLIPIYVDPIKRLEASMIQLRLNDLARQITQRGHRQAQAILSRKSADLRARLDALAAQAKTIESEIADYRHKFERARSSIRTAIEEQIQRHIDDLKAQTQAATDQAVATMRAELAAKVSARRNAMVPVENYLGQLQSSRQAFEQWLRQLKAMAGSHADRIPPPPRWPTPPSQAQLAELSKPLDLSFQAPDLPAMPTLQDLKIRIPALPSPPNPKLALAVKEIRPDAAPLLPGGVGWRDRSLTPGHLQVNSFDQYVPGFGITFLLIDVLWGVSVGLIDERDWGTLQRLRASGAPVSGILVGKMLAHFLIGLVQLVVLFAVGWLLFGISLGARPWGLLLPAAAISFAAAGFGLIIACLARTRDAVLPIGAVAAMAMSAIGGCWWPIGFEPSWMRALALWLPTTWTMQAFNDLMIRGLEPASALWPAAITFGLGLIYLVAGLAGSFQLFD